MQIHGRAKLGPAGRLALCQAIESGLTFRAAARASSVPPAGARSAASAANRGTRRGGELDWHRCSGESRPACESMLAGRLVPLIRRAASRVVPTPKGALTDASARADPAGRPRRSLRGGDLPHTRRTGPRAADRGLLAGGDVRAPRAALEADPAEHRAEEAVRRD